MTDAQIEEKMDLYEAVDKFAEAMKYRLLEKLLQGYSGWNDPEKITDGSLSSAISKDALNDPVTKSVDIANRAMMLWWRKKSRLHGCTRQ